MSRLQQNRSTTIIECVAGGNGMVTSGVTLHQKSVLSPAVFESQLSTDSTVHTSIATGFKTNPASTHFIENCKKIEIPPIFTQKPSFSLISERFNWADDVKSSLTTSITSTKLPRDFSALRSSLTNPFSSLRRRRRNRGKPQHFTNFQPRSNCKYTPSYPYHHYSSNLWAPHQISQHPPSLLTSLHWDQDPHLADLSKALQALGSNVSSHCFIYTSFAL